MCVDGTFIFTALLLKIQAGLLAGTDVNPEWFQFLVNGIGVTLKVRPFVFTVNLSALDMPLDAHTVSAPEGTVERNLINNEA